MAFQVNYCHNWIEYIAVGNKIFMYWRRKNDAHEMFIFGIIFSSNQMNYYNADDTECIQIQRAHFDYFGWGGVFSDLLLFSEKETLIFSLRWTEFIDEFLHSL